MRRLTAIILAAVLLICGSAAAEELKAPDYILEGFDGDSTNCVWETNLFFTRMQEKTGISFQFRQASSAEDWQSRKKEIAEGADLPDVLFKAELTPAETLAMYENGILVDLKPYLEDYAPDLWALLQEHPDWLEAITLPGGAIAALPAFNTLQNNDFMWINTRWLSRLEMEMPRTADELTEVLRAFKTRDPNGNGSADEVPLTFIGMWELRFLGHAFGIIDNDYYIRLQDGKVTSSLTSDENRAFLTWLHSLWEEGLLDRDGFYTADSLRQITDENKAIPYGVIMTPTPLTVIPAASAGQYEILMPLEWNGKRVYRELTGDVIRGTFAITSACKEPERLVSWVNLLYTEEGSRLAQYGQEGEEYGWDGNGYWEWLEDLNTVAQVILTERTIGSGNAAPGIAMEDFQLHYSEETTRRNIEMMAEIEQYCVYPYPYTVLSSDDAAAVAGIHTELMKYAEAAMACFVTGDLEMNDANWNTFCETVHAKGLDDEIAIWQKYAEKRSEQQ